MDTYACSSPTSRCDTFPSVDNPTDYRVAPGAATPAATTGLLNETRGQRPATAPRHPGGWCPYPPSSIRALPGPATRATVRPTGTAG